MIIYTVKHNDTLQKIARDYMGNSKRWREIRLLTGSKIHRFTRDLVGEVVDYGEFRFSFQDSRIFEGDVLLVPCNLIDGDVPYVYAGGQWYADNIGSFDGEAD